MRGRNGPGKLVAGVAALALVLGFVGAGAGTAAAGEGDVAGIRISLPKGFTVSGTIRAETGAPIANVVVRMEGGTRDDAGPLAQTDARGRFRIVGVRRGLYRIHAMTPEPYQEGYYRSQRATRFTALAAHATRVQIDHNRTHLDMIIPRGVVIAGRVLLSNGRAARADIMAELGTNSMARRGVTLADKSGRYRMAGMTPGTYRLAIYGKSGDCDVRGFFAAGVPGRLVGERRDATLISVRDRLVVPTVTLPRGYIVSGRLLDGAGAPISRASVHLAPAHGSCWTATNKDGSWALAGVPAGPVTIGFGAPDESSLLGGYFSSEAPGHLALERADATSLLIVGDTGGLEALLPEGRTLSGRIDDTDGRGLADAAVRVVRVDGEVERAAGTDSAGAFFITGIAPGSYRLSVDSPIDEEAGVTVAYQSGWYRTDAPGSFTAHLAEASTFRIDEGDAAIEVALPRGFAISGQVVDPSASRSFMLVVAPCVDDPALGASAEVDARGRFLLVGLVPCRYRIGIQEQARLLGYGTWQSGWYRRGAKGNWTATEWKATLLVVGAAR